MDPERPRAHAEQEGELATFLKRIQNDLEGDALENSVFYYYEDDLEILAQYDDDGATRGPGPRRSRRRCRSRP